MARRLFTSESVTEGHPDKMADQISDVILDAMLKDDPASRVAVETLITTGQVHVAGEVTTKTYVDIPGIIREKILQIGYDSSAKGYDGASCGVSVSIGSQSPDIAQGVTDAFEYREGEGADDFDRQGAGDQGLMFGYACRETPELMPLPIMLAHKLARQLSAVRRSGQVPYLRPDGKTQVTIEYAGDKPVRLDTVVVSSQHAPDINLKELLAPDVKDYVVDPVLAGLDIDTAGTACSSTRPAGSRSAAPWATPGSPAARSSSTPTAAWPGTAAARSPARTRPRWTAAPRTRCAGWPRTWSPRSWPTGARRRSPTRSARPSRWACSSSASARRRCPSSGSRTR